MILLTEKQLIELLHKATGNIKDFVTDNRGWLYDNLPTEFSRKDVEDAFIHGVKSCMSTRDINEEGSLDIYMDGWSI